MPKIDIETIKQILHRNESDIQKVNSILEDLKLEIQIQEEERANRLRRRNINSGWVIENVAEWDLEYCKRHGKMPEL